MLQVQLWSRLGRLKRSTFPKMTGGGHTFGGGAAPGLLNVLAGRLLCDTYLSGETIAWSTHTLNTWNDAVYATWCSVALTHVFPAVVCTLAFLQ